MADLVERAGLYVLGLLRHAKSDYPADVSDHQRPLSDRGRRDAGVLGPLITARIGALDLALVSDATRAQQTWNLAGTTARSQRDEPRIYEAAVNTLLNLVTGISAGIHTVVMVGHNPGFEALAHQLAGEDSEPAAFAQLETKYPTCALAVLESSAPFGQWASEPVRLRSFDIARG